MIKVSYKRPKGFASQGKKAEKELRSLVSAKLMLALRQMQEAILQTPVYTGKTLINYHWSTGSPVDSVRGPVKSPALPGKTSEMALGEEPRRSANAAIVEMEFRRVLSSVKTNPYGRIFLTNTASHFNEVEYGTYTSDTKRESRTPPGGMVRRGETAVRYALGGLASVSGS